MFPAAALMLAWVFLVFFLGTSPAHAGTDSMLTVSDPCVMEGTAANSTLVFTITAGEVPKGISFDYSTADCTATDADNDYEPTSGSRSLSTGETFMVSVTVNADAKVEDDETLKLNLTNIMVAGFPEKGSFQGTGTIKNDDCATLSIGDVSMAEGTGGTTIFDFDVTLSAAVDAPDGVKVDFSTTANSASSSSDFTSDSGCVTFTGTAGEMQTISVSVAADNLVEADETFFVDLSNPRAVGVDRKIDLDDSQGQGSIENDDRAIVQINDVTMNEGDAGLTVFPFQVTFSNPVDVEIKVGFATMDRTATLADNDYQMSSGLLCFDPNDTSETIPVNVVGDTNMEPTETFLVRLNDLLRNGRDIILDPNDGPEPDPNDPNDPNEPMGPPQLRGFRPIDGLGTMFNDDNFSPTDVFATKIVDGDFIRGGFILYTVELFNNSPNLQPDNPGPEFTDMLPPGVRLERASSNFGTITEDRLQGKVEWNGSIPPMGRVVIFIEGFIRYSPGGPEICNQGEVFFDSQGNGMNGGTRLTDDPDLPGDEDPTCFILESLPAESSPIPTLGEWSLILLSLGMSLVLVRKRFA